MICVCRLPTCSLLLLAVLLLAFVFLRFLLFPFWSGGRVPTQALGLNFGHRMTRATLHANYLRIPLVRTQHPVQPHQQFASDRYFGHPVVLFLNQALVHPTQFCISSGRAHARLH